MEFIELKAQCEAQMRLDVCHGCDACWLRCAHDVPANRDEWEALQAYLHAASPDLRAYIDRVRTQDKSANLGDGVSVEMCRFFDMETRRCSVYLARPLACRLLGHVEWMPCPIERVPQTIATPDALALMRAYAATERRTFAEWSEE